MKKNFLILLTLIFIGLLGFWLGLRIGNRYPDANSVNEIHFIDPKYLPLMRPASFPDMLKNILNDSLKNVRPPFTESKIDNIITAIENKTRLRNLIRKLFVDSNSYSIIVGSGSNSKIPYPYYLLTQDTFYYLKPLKIKYDLKP